MIEFSCPFVKNTSSDPQFGQEKIKFDIFGDIGVWFLISFGWYHISDVRVT
jgi:hypothetical protein